MPDYAKKTFHLSTIQILAAILSVGLNLILTPRYGIAGAVSVSCLVGVCQCLMAHFMSRGYYRIPFEWGKISRLTLVALGIVIAIGQISVEEVGLSVWLDQSLTPGVSAFMQAAHLDTIKNGKLLVYVTGNIPLVVEGALKLLMSMVFIPVLVYFGVVPQRFFNPSFAWKNLRQMLRGRGGKKLP